jgi:putative endonuclease
MLPAGFTRLPIWRRWFGRRAERYAAKYLRRNRYRILGCNLDDRLGEIDLLALDGQTIVVVEVRSSETKTFDELAATVNHDKQRRLTDATLRFVQRRKLWNVGVRFDVIAMRWPPGAREPEVRHYRHAFQSVGKYQFRS